MRGFLCVRACACVCVCVIEKAATARQFGTDLVGGGVTGAILLLKVGLRNAHIDNAEVLKLVFDCPLLHFTTTPTPSAIFFTPSTKKQKHSPKYLRDPFILPPLNMGVITASFHIPTIDIAPYLRDPSTDAARQVVRDVRNACATVGFFSLVGHGVPRGVQDNVFRAAKRLFDLPPEEKEALRHPLMKNRGYELIGSQALQVDTLPDLKEVHGTDTAFCQ